MAAEFCSGCESMMTKTERLRKSFFLQVIRLIGLRTRSLLLLQKPKRAVITVTEDKCFTKLATLKDKVLTLKMKLAKMSVWWTYVLFLAAYCGNFTSMLLSSFYGYLFKPDIIRLNYNAKRI